MSQQQPWYVERNEVKTKKQKQTRTVIAASTIENENERTKVNGTKSDASDRTTTKKKKKWRNSNTAKKRKKNYEMNNARAVAADCVDGDERERIRKESERRAMLEKAPKVSMNFQKLIALGEIKQSAKGKHRKHDFERKRKEDDDDDSNDDDNGDDGVGELKRPVPQSRDQSVTEILGIDCEMVGVGEDGQRSALARVTVVNEHGNVVLDTFVDVIERVTDYRTKVSGVRPRDLKNAPKFADVQKMVSKLIEKKIVVGHGLKNDFKALLLNHPRERTRDTALYHPLTRPLRSHERCVEGAPRGRGSRSLKELTKTHLRMIIQEGEHSSAEDARAALFLYSKFKKKWERHLLLKKLYH